MADISLDYGDLRGAVTNLRYVATQLEASDDTSEAAAEAVGHDALADRLREFADSWDDNRKGFHEAATSLADGIDAIVCAFQDLDRCMAG